MSSEIAVQPFVFRKGITLKDYIAYMPDQSQQYNQFQKQDQLFLNPNGQSLNPYPINQIIEENYQEDERETPTFWINTKQVEKDVKVIEKKPSNIIKQYNGKSVLNSKRLNKLNITQSKAFKISNKSNSPCHQIHSRKNEIFRTMYGTPFLQPLMKRTKPQLNDIHSMMIKGHRNVSLNTKQIRIKQQNYKNYEDVVKYEKMVECALNKKVGFKKEGFRDKIYQKKFMNRNAF